MWNEEAHVPLPRVRTRSPSPTPVPPPTHSSLSTTTFPVFHNTVYGLALESNESMPYSLSQSQHNAPLCANRQNCCQEEEENPFSTSSSVLTLLRQFFTRGCEVRDLAPCAYAAGPQQPQQYDTAGRLLLCCLDTIGEMGASLLQQQEKWNEAALRGEAHPTAAHFHSQQQRSQQIHRVLRRAAERLALIELLLTNQKPSSCRPHTKDGAARHDFLPSSSSSSSAVSATAAIMTPRDMYYRLESVFPSQAVLNRTLNTVSRLTGCSRDRFGVEAGGRGAVGGLLYLGAVDASAMGPQGLPLSGADYMTSFEEAVQESLRRETGSMESHDDGAGLPAPSASFSRIDSSVSHARNAGLILDASRARYLLIIEKDAIFYRLMEQQLYRKLPVILITSAGFPTVAVRRLVHRLLMEQPSLQPYALVDYNPSGVSIMLNYMHALRAPKRSLLLPRSSSTKQSASQMNAVKSSEGEMIEITSEREGHYSTTLPPLNEDSSLSFSIPNLKWIGLRSAQIDAMTRSADAKRVADVDACSPLSSRDKQMLRKLLRRTTRSDSNGAHSSSSWPLPERWHAELAQMQQRDYSMEIEALDSLLLLKSPTMRLSDWVVECVLQQDAI